MPRWEEAGGCCRDATRVTASTERAQGPRPSRFLMVSLNGMDLTVGPIGGNFPSKWENDHDRTTYRRLSLRRRAIFNCGEARTCCRLPLLAMPPADGVLLCGGQRAAHGPCGGRR